MKNAMVSIIITTKNSASTLEALLKSISNQSYKQIEIILVDNKSNDATTMIALKYTDKVFQKSPERSAQRNFGIKKSEGQYLLILDSDMVMTKNVVKECVDKINSETSIGGLVIPEKSFGIGIWAEAKTFEREINEGESDFEAARFFPKKIVKEFGGYDETITGPEDWDLPRRVSKKYKIDRIKSYILHNEGELSLATLCKKKYYYGLSVYRFLKKNNQPTFSSVTIYFLRSAFYRKWNMLLARPVLTLVMVMMLFFEMVAGGIGYLKGRFIDD